MVPAYQRIPTIQSSAGKTLEWYPKRVPLFLNGSYVVMDGETVHYS